MKFYAGNAIGAENRQIIYYRWFIHYNIYKIFRWYIQYINIETMMRCGQNYVDKEYNANKL